MSSEFWLREIERQNGVIDPDQQQRNLISLRLALKKEREAEKE